MVDITGIDRPTLERLPNVWRIGPIRHDVPVVRSVRTGSCSQPGPPMIYYQLYAPVIGQLRAESAAWGRRRGSRAKICALAPLDGLRCGH